MLRLATLASIMVVVLVVRTCADDRSSSSAEPLAFQLYAPFACEAAEWKWGRLQDHDEVTFEVAWNVRGGREPYVVEIDGELYRGATGRLRLPCQTLEDGITDSGLISVAGHVTDATEQTVSKEVHTYAIARSSFDTIQQYQGPRRLHGGKTYRFERLLMTIPEGLTIDISDGFGGIEVECSADSCTELSCANELRDNVCESLFYVWTKGRSVQAYFGYTTRALRSRRITDLWYSDPGVDADSKAEVEDMVDRWAESVGEEPVAISEDMSNPEPLQISAHLDPPNCSRGFWGGEEAPVTTNAYITVSGGRWVPTGIEVDGRLVELARGHETLFVEDIECQEDTDGYAPILFNVHDLGDDPAYAEVTLEPWSEVVGRLETIEGMRAEAKAYQTAEAKPYLSAEQPGGLKRTHFCEPGGFALVRWEVWADELYLPFAIRINGKAEAEFALKEMPFLDDQLAGQAIEAWVDCLDRAELQSHMLELLDNRTPPERIVVPVYLQAVAEHPSGIPWSELRGSDYPD